jgi:predicted ATP-grasp superfamily ATP-dependent carboligase
MTSLCSDHATLPTPPFSGAAISLPPVVVLDGEGAPNGLSVARCLGLRGIKVYGLTPPASYLRYSRYCTWIPATATGPETVEARAEYLLGPDSNWLRGAVLLACYDPALQLLARYRDQLQEKYRLDLCNPPAQLCMLDKLATYQAAVAAGVPTPRFWVAQNHRQVLGYRDELVYPLLVKPLLSHVYRARFETKFATVHNWEELLEAYGKAEDAGIDVMLVEEIPGLDDRLCSYFTYVDEQGNAVFDFTKRVIRRYPAVRGPGCHHVTDWIPELCEPALKLFRQVGLRGVANVEFKRDDRDGVLKLIECNARFTASNSLVADSGHDIASLVYNRIVGLPQKPFGRFKVGKRLLYPIEDFYACRILRREGKLTLWQWLKSVAHPTTFPIFRWSDPRPTLVFEWKRIRQGLARRWQRWFPPRTQKADRPELVTTH